MRPYRPQDVDRVTAVTSRFPRMHGGPIHVGDPGQLGIADLARPDFGDPVEIRAGEVPLFWACGVTPQLALAGAGCELAITHSPGCMFVTDLPESAMEENVVERIPEVSIFGKQAEPMTVSLRPTNLELVSPNRLVIDWSDGERREYTFRELRDRCPCATCREKRQKPAAPPNPLAGAQPGRSPAAGDQGDGAGGQLCLFDRLQRRPRHGDLHARVSARAGHGGQAAVRHVAAPPRRAGSEAA